MSKSRHSLKESYQSSETTLMTVENLINKAMRLPKKNEVNFRTLQTVLHILAKHMRILETLVEVRVDEETDKKIDEMRSEKRVMEGEKFELKEIKLPQEELKESIQVVTQSQFELLKSAVEELQQKAGPFPEPELPDNEKLRDDLAKGTASLTDTMEAMKLNARIQAAENTIKHLSAMITKLATPVKVEENAKKKTKEQTVEENTEKTKGEVTLETMREAVEGITDKTKDLMSVSAIEASNRYSTVPPFLIPGVTHKEMQDALRGLTDKLMKLIRIITAESTSRADRCHDTVKSVEEKMEEVLKLNARISELHSLANDYNTQLNGFDEGIKIQIQVFQQEISMIRADLNQGLAVFEQQVNANESEVILQMKEHYAELVSQLEETLTAHHTLTFFQENISAEMQSVMQCVEMLQEQKSDRDEMLDALKDKADMSRLEGLVTQNDLEKTCHGLDTKLEVCYEKFEKQDRTWMELLQDLSNEYEEKADFVQLQSLRYNVQEQLRELDNKIHYLATRLGEPKAAVLCRRVSKLGVCGSCMVNALIEPQDPDYGIPPKLPSLRPRHIVSSSSDTDKNPCLKDGQLPIIPDVRHSCNRWCGGSHTLLTRAITRERACPVVLQTIPTKKYVDCGDDGRLYMMEEEMKPCMQCNKPTVNKFEEHLPPVPPTSPSHEGSEKGH